MRSLVVAAVCLGFHGVYANENVDKGLINASTLGPVSPSAEKVIVLIHGWNRTGSDNPFLNEELSSVKRSLTARTSDTDWTLALFDWSSTASTGGNFATDSVTAAENAVNQGLVLAGQLNNLGSLKRVHLITWSAGAWLGRSAAIRILELTEGRTQVQLTQLDPFIPSVVLGNASHHLNVERMSDIDEILHSFESDLFLLENYYSHDVSAGTREIFSWRSQDINLRVDWKPALEDPAYYDGHEGPILFFSDTITYADEPIPLRLGNFAPVENVGWNRSMFVREPYFRIHPKDRSVSASMSAEFVVDVEQRGDYLPNTPTPEVRWQTKVPNGGWVFTGVPGFGVTIANIGKHQNGTLVRAIATVNGLSESSDIATLTVVDSTTPSSPAAPFDFKVRASASNRIDLSWKNNATNHSGFKIERRLSTDSNWNGDPIATVGKNSTSFSNVGLAPGTSYDFRIYAYNSSNLPANYSRVESATTLGVAAVNHTLTVNSVDLSVPQTLGVSAYSWEGSSSGFRSNATPFTRTSQAGREVTVSVPATLPGGRIFQYWLKDGSGREFGTTVKITMDGQHVLDAVYGTSTPVNRTLQSLKVLGPSSVDERRAASYTARATFTDGTVSVVTAVWTEDSNYASISSNGVLDTASVSSDKSVTVSASASIGGVTRSDTKNVTIENVDEAPTYMLDLSAMNGRISASPDLRSYERGTEVRLRANPDDDYLFSHWSGDASGSDRTVYVRMNGNRSVTAHFVDDTRTGGIRINLSPPEAAGAGGFKIAGEGMSLNNWQDSGTLISGRKPGDYTVSFKPIPGWVSPESLRVAIPGGETVQFTGIYRELLGSIQVGITPPAAAAAGARWRIDGGPWQESGVTLSNVNSGIRNIQFSTVEGWTSPSSFAVEVSGAGLVQRSAGYGPPPGLPIIQSISPRTGPLGGGTEIVIDGVNFQAGATVTVGGAPATAVIVESGTRVRATSPARASYGSVPVAVVSGGQTASVPNGFSYLEPSGANLELVGQWGGEFQSVAVAGSHAYAGEGASLVTFDVSAPSAPVRRGKIALPGIVYGISVTDGKAYVAAGRAGFFIIDVSVPASPAIIGFYDTPGTAYDVEINGNLAYVADGSEGLQIFDVSMPEAPVRIGFLDTPGEAQRLTVGTVGATKIGCVADSSAGARIIDVTIPSSPMEVSSISSAHLVYDVKLVGDLLYVVGTPDNLRVFNLGDPASPALLSSATFSSAANTLDTVGTDVYLGGSYLKIVDAENPASLLPINSNTATTKLKSQRQLVVSAGMVYIAESGGLKVFSVGTPSSPSLDASIPAFGAVAGLAAQGTTVLAGGESNGMNVINASNPAAPMATGHFGSSRVSHLAVADSLAVLVSYGSSDVSVVDISQPSAPVLRSTYSATEAWDVAFLGVRPVIAGATLAGPQMPVLDTLSLSNPASPQRVSLFQIGSSAGRTTGVSFFGNFGFATQQNTGLRIVDFSSLASPAATGFLPMEGYLQGTAISGDGNFAYVAEQGTGIRVVDVTDKSAPAIVGTLVPNPSSTSNTKANGVKVLGNRLFVTSFLHVSVFDISIPAVPVRVAYYDLPGVSDYGTKIDAVDDLLHIASGKAGLMILRVKDLEKPLVTISSPTSNSTHETDFVSVSIAGSSSDNGGVTRVTWSNSRGGGGNADGTVAWSISEAQLASGLNRITVTAEDEYGNIGSDFIDVIANFPDSTPPAIAILAPVPEPETTTFDETVTVSGTVVDDTEVASVIWTDSNGSSGVASVSGETWSLSGLSLVMGPNVVTITAEDSFGNTSSDSIAILRSELDVDPPVITIRFPSDVSDFHVRDSAISLSGDCEDDGELIRVSWVNHRGGSGDAAGAENWLVDQIGLFPGVNIITVTAVDASGKSGEDTITVTYTPIDHDDDGIPDDWELLHFPDLEAISGTTDGTGSGFSDFEKFAFGIDPVTPSVDTFPRLIDDASVDAEFPVFRYRRPISPGEILYDVGVSTDLELWDWSGTLVEQVGVPNPVGDGINEEVTIRLAPSFGQQIDRVNFRVRARIPEN